MTNGPSLNEIADALFEIGSEEVHRLEMMKASAGRKGGWRKRKPPADAIERAERRTLCIVEAHGIMRKMAVVAV